MTQSREDEFIDSYTGRVREELSREELRQALSAFEALKRSSDFLEVDTTEESNDERIARQIEQISAKIPTAEYNSDNVVAFPKKRQKQFAAIGGAMAACLALAIGLNLQSGATLQSDDWGNEIVVRGNADLDTTEISTLVDSPKKSVKNLAEQLASAGATYRSEKKSGSGYRVAFRLREMPDSKLTEQLSTLGVEAPEVGRWYVLELVE